jgi:thiamine kinase-like enzyme
MNKYGKYLIKRDKHFFIGRYIEILNKKGYKKTPEFEEYGDALWSGIKDLPRGYCHGDMYCGNIHKTPKGDLYILDFDTSCESFPLYDIALICNRTDYFNYDEQGYGKTKAVFERMLPEYIKHNAVRCAETSVIFDLIALYHFALQATIIELYGLDCVDAAFLDKQLDWLCRWREQCRK